MKQISIETKASIIDRFNIGESVSELTEATGVARRLAVYLYFIMIKCIKPDVLTMF
ncbi:hypothetical protein SAMN02910436_01876 [Ruminococcaceae bacterium P7]|nr:hypothetical protein SAMN02910436_01876 [Ruminococcaceae bacterium P7]